MVREQYTRANIMLILIPITTLDGDRNVPLHSCGPRLVIAARRGGRRLECARAFRSAEPRAPRGARRARSRLGHYSLNGRVRHVPAERASLPHSRLSAPIEYLS